MALERVSEPKPGVVYIRGTSVTRAVHVGMGFDTPVPCRIGALTDAHGSEVGASEAAYARFDLDDGSSRYAPVVRPGPIEFALDERGVVLGPSDGPPFAPAARPLDQVLRFLRDALSPADLARLKELVGNVMACVASDKASAAAKPAPEVELPVGAPSGPIDVDEGATDRALRRRARRAG